MQSKYPLFTIVDREIKRIRNKWITIFSILILPAVAFVLMTTIFSRGLPRDLDIAVVDNDHSAFSRNIIRTIDATPIVRIAEAHTDVEAAYVRMRKGQLHAIVVIPEEASRKVMRQEASPVVLYVDNTNIVTGGLIANGIRTAASTVSGQVKVMNYMHQGKSMSQAKALAQPVAVKDHILFNPYVSYSFFLLTGLLPLMLIVFVFLNTIHSLGTELKYGTAKELMEKANGSVRLAVAGKLLPLTIIYLLFAVLMNYILFIYVGAPMNGSFPLIVLSELILILAYQMMAVALVAITYNMRLSLSLGSAYTMMALTFAGLTFPLTGMPLLARVFSYIFPFRFWIEAFIGQSLRGEPLFISLESLLALAAFIVVGLLFLPLMKKRLTHNIYYGKI